MNVGSLVVTPDGLGEVAASTEANVLVDLFRPIPHPRWEISTRWYAKRDCPLDPRTKEEA